MIPTVLVPAMGGSDVSWISPTLSLLTLSLRALLSFMYTLLEAVYTDPFFFTYGILET